MRSLREMSLYAQWRAELEGGCIVIDAEPDLKGNIRMVAIGEPGADPWELELPPAIVLRLLRWGRSESVDDKRAFDEAIERTESAIKELERRQRVERGQT